MNLNSTHRNFALVLALSTLISSAAWGQLPSSQDVDASATLSIPLEIFDHQNLSFGELVKTAAHDSGEVVASFAPLFLAPGAMTLTGTGVVDPDPADHLEGLVWFTGDPLKQVVIDAGPSTITLEKAGATSDQQRMALDLTYILTNSLGEVVPSAPPDTFPMASGTHTLEFGGSLHIKFDNESGVYSGTIPVTLSYL